MKILFLFLITVASNSLAQVIATCGSLEGFSYYHYSGKVPKKSSGFDKDRISGGMTTFQKMSDGSYDILVVDVRRKIISMTQDGGQVFLMRGGKNDATFLLYFPNNSIEIYTLWTDFDGRFKYDLLSSRGGDETPIHKSSVLVGDCDRINFELIGK